MRNISILTLVSLAIIATGYSIGKISSIEPVQLAERAPRLEDWHDTYGDSIRTFTFETIPTSLPEFLLHPGTTTIDYTVIPEDMWIIGAKTEVKGGPPELLHHTNYINLSSPPTFCGSGYPFFASGREMTSGFFPLTYAYPAMKGDRIKGLVMYHNESDVSYGGVQTVITFWYIPQSVAKLKAVYPLSVDVFAPCVLGDFTIPSGTLGFREESDAPYVVEEPGEVVLVGSHLHDHANFITLMVNGNEAFTVRPTKDADGHILSIPIVYPHAMSLKKGDELGVKMEADNTHTDHDHDMMAQMFLYVHLTQPNL